ncbi:MAG: YciI family protein [Nocardioides sp.]|uniref:YciI family protein n=1 Tax=Nocardioides sp. TaxID=35761 RepID=UPI0039E2EDD1
MPTLPPTSTVAVTYRYDDDLETQNRVRPEHRAFLGRQPNLLLSGPTDDGGALLVFAGEPAEIEAVLDEDPFRIAGVIAERSVTTWNVVLGTKAGLLNG